MANTTVPFAESVHGTNPQYLIEKITRLKIYNSTYWKEHCFGLTSELIIDKAVALKYCGGVYGGNNKPCNFLCLVLKLLQLQPEKEIVLEFIRNEEFKYLRLLGAFYLRMVGKPDEVYEYLEPLYNDYRKVAYRSAKGWQLTYVDEFVHWLLSQEMVCDITLPHIMRREKLEDLGQLQPRRSVLEDEFNEAEEQEENEDDDEKEEQKKGNHSSAGGMIGVNGARGSSGIDSGVGPPNGNEPKQEGFEARGAMITDVSERYAADSIDKPKDRNIAAEHDSRVRDGGRMGREGDVAGAHAVRDSSGRGRRSRSRGNDGGMSRRRRSRSSSRSRSRSISRRRRRSRSRDRDRRGAYRRSRSRSRSDDRRGGGSGSSRRRRRSSRSDSDSDYEKRRERRHRDHDDRRRDRADDRGRRRSRRSSSRSSSRSRERSVRRREKDYRSDGRQLERSDASQPSHEFQPKAEHKVDNVEDDFESRMDAELAQAQAEAQRRKDDASSKKFDKLFGKSNKSAPSSGGDSFKLDKSKFAEGSVEYWNEMREKLGMKKLKS